MNARMLPSQLEKRAHLHRIQDYQICRLRPSSSIDTQAHSSLIQVYCGTRISEVSQLATGMSPSVKISIWKLGTMQVAVGNKVLHCQERRTKASVRTIPLQNIDSLARADRTHSWASKKEFPFEIEGQASQINISLLEFWDY